MAEGDERSDEREHVPSHAPFTTCHGPTRNATRQIELRRRIRGVAKVIAKLPFLEINFFSITQKLCLNPRRPRNDATPNSIHYLYEQHYVTPTLTDCNKQNQRTNTPL
jgi:hypothetical protein